MLKNIASHYGFVMRVSLGFVFVWFGISEVFNPNYFRVYVPPFISNFGFDNDLLIQIHGGLLIVLFLCLVFKIYLKITGLASVFILTSIVFGLLITPEFGFNEIAVRDIGLLGLSLAIWLNEVYKD